jgi:hypothetical protein
MGGNQPTGIGQRYQGCPEGHMNLNSDLQAKPAKVNGGASSIVAENHDGLLAAAGTPTASGAADLAPYHN